MLTYTAEKRRTCTHADVHKTTWQVLSSLLCVLRLTCASFMTASKKFSLKKLREKMSRRKWQISINNSRCRQLGLRAHSVRVCEGEESASKEKDKLLIIKLRNVPKRTRLLLVVLPSMILVQSSCRCSVFLMCRMKRHSVLAAASFTGNTYCWGKQWRVGGEEGGSQHYRLVVFQLHIMFLKTWEQTLEQS